MYRLFLLKAENYKGKEKYLNDLIIEQNPAKLNITLTLKNDGDTRSVQDVGL